MKTRKLKFWSITYLLFFVLLTGTLFAQSAANLTGVFEGTRSQFDDEHQNLIKEFTYKYELKQIDNLVRGISTIISADGNYAEVGIRGIVVKDKFYFEEYRMMDQIKDEGMQWCYKSGVLNISEERNQIVLSGETPSYMVNYGFACSGGVTKLSSPKKEDSSASTAQKEGISSKSVAITLDLYPNPTADIAKIKFYAESESTVQIEIFDLSGKAYIGVAERKIPKGEFRESINVSKLSNGLYIFKIKINDEIITRDIVKF